MATSVRLNEVDSEALAHRAPSARRSEQYSLAKILGLWALATVPMGLYGARTTSALLAEHRERTNGV